MKEIFQPLYDKVDKVLKGEDFGTIVTGLPDAYVEVSKELVGRKCFSSIVRDALLMKLEWGVKKLREKGIVNSQDSWTSFGDVNSDIDIALDLSQTLFPNVLNLTYTRANGEKCTVEELYAFLPCSEIDLENVCDILGKGFKAIYEERHSPYYKENDTESLYDFIVHAAIIPF